MPEGEQEEQKIENLFEKIMKDNFPNLVKEIDIQVQEVQRVPNKLDPKRTTPRHIVIKMPKVKDKEKILKADSYLLRGSHKALSRFLKRNFADKKGLARSIQSGEKQGLTTKITLPSKVAILN